PYGTEITPERLARIDRFEDGLRALGFGQLRVRFHDTIARLELDGAELARAIDPPTRQQIVALGAALGFTHVPLDPGGYPPRRLPLGRDERGRPAPAGARMIRAAVLALAVVAGAQAHAGKLDYLAAKSAARPSARTDAQLRRLVGKPPAPLTNIVNIWTQET